MDTIATGTTPAAAAAAPAEATPAAAAAEPAAAAAPAETGVSKYLKSQGLAA